MVWPGELREGMTKHYIERALIGALLLISIWKASEGAWGPAGYTLFLASFINFEDWSHGGGG